jgi:hypothetical protein
MSNQNKKTVLIITLGDEYSSESNNGSQIQEYGNKIKNNNRIEANHLVRFLSAKDIVKDNAHENDLDSFFEPYSIELSMDDEDVYDMLEEGIFKMLEDTGGKAQKDIDTQMNASCKDKKCYIKFEHKDETTGSKYDVVLLLWDVLGRDRGEQIVPFGLFIEQVCKDLGIKDKTDESGYTNNMLYVHDLQLIGFNDDQTIIDRSNPSFKGAYDNEKYIGTLKKYFDYVAVFGHSATGGIFQNYILQFQFGPTFADKTAVLEVEADSFQSLRNKAEEILS